MQPASGKHETSVGDLGQIAHTADPKTKTAQAAPSASSAPPASSAPVAGDGQ